jgi:biotin carboxyl carrier protein
MKKYRVIVDGQEYEVGIEPLDQSELKAPAPAAAPAPAPAPAAGDEQVLSPMPGNILSVNVKAGSAVKKGEVLMVLEAMKMENEIIAPRDATVASVSVASGAAVDTGALLCTLR